MIRRTRNFRIGLIAAPAVLVGAVLAVTPASASAAQSSTVTHPASSTPFYTQLYRYNETAPIGFECVTDGASGVSMQPCASNTADDQQWTWTVSNPTYQNEATGECLNGDAVTGDVTMEPCDTSTYPDENWTSEANPDVILNTTNDECLNADAATGDVTMDPCDTSTYPGEIINWLYF